MFFKFLLQKWFGHDVGNHTSRWTVLQFDFGLLDELSYIVVDNVNVFGAAVIYWIVCESNRRLIVLMNDGCVCLRMVDFG